MRKNLFKSIIQNTLLLFAFLLIIKALQSCSDPCASQPPENLELRVVFKDSTNREDKFILFNSIQGTGNSVTTFQAENENDTINSINIPLSPFVDEVQYVFTRAGETQTLDISYQRERSTACGFKTSNSGITIKEHNFKEAEVVRSIIDRPNENNIVLYF